MKVKEAISSKVVECKKCKRPYLGFTGLDIEPEKQPCPHCERKKKK